MAKVKAPLFSFSAAGKIADALIYGSWKGINTVKSYVVPSNPQTTLQQTQRGYMTSVVDDIHAAQALAVDPLSQDDTVAYEQYGRTLGKTMSWWNAVIKQCVDQLVAGKNFAIFRAGGSTPADGQLTVTVDFSEETGAGEAITAGDFFYGTSPSALINSIAATVAADNATKAITGLTNGTKYYWQFRSSSHDDFDGCRSGIYHGTPAA